MADAGAGAGEAKRADGGAGAPGPGARADYAPPPPLRGGPISRLAEKRGLYERGGAGSSSFRNEAAPERDASEELDRVPSLKLLELKAKHASVIRRRERRFVVGEDKLVFGRLLWLRSLLLGLTICTALLASLMWTAGYNPRDLDRAYVAQAFNALNLWALLVHVFANAEFGQVQKLLWVHLGLFVFSGLLRNVADLAWKDQPVGNAVFSLAAWILGVAVMVPAIGAFQKILRQRGSNEIVATVMEHFMLAAGPGLIVVLYFTSEVLNCFYLGDAEAGDDINERCVTLYYSNEMLALFSVGSTFLSFVLYHDAGFELIDVIRLTLEWKVLGIGFFFAVSSLISVTLVAFRDEDLADFGEGPENPVVTARYAPSSPPGPARPGPARPGPRRRARRIPNALPHPPSPRPAATCSTPAGSSSSFSRACASRSTPTTTS